MGEEAYASLNNNRLSKTACSLKICLGYNFGNNIMWEKNGNKISESILLKCRTVGHLPQTAFLFLIQQPGFISTVFRVFTIALITPRKYEYRDFLKMQPIAIFFQKLITLFVTESFTMGDEKDITIYDIAKHLNISATNSKSWLKGSTFY